MTMKKHPISSNKAETKKASLILDKDFMIADASF